MRKVRALISLFGVIALAVAGLTLGGAGSASAVGNTLQVPSQYATIQDAVNAAGPSGGTIIVQPGNYNESVVIMKNGITIKGAPNKPPPVLGPPADPDTGCNALPQGELDGFCILSAGPQPVKNVEIANFEIENFPATGIFADNADGLNFHDNILMYNAEYGIARFSSSHTQIVNNFVIGSGEAGIYVGDSPNASVLVRRNIVISNQFGIFLRDSSHGTVTENTAVGNCFGILLIDTEAPGASFDWTLVHNTTDNNTLACPPSEEGPPTSGAGIVIAGATHARLTGNEALGNVPSDSSLVSGGIAVISTLCIGGADPTYVQVDHSTLGGNSPADLVYDGTGHHNTFSANGVPVTLISPPIPCED